ncbi:phage head-tail connector protein [Saccharomonospora cyanea]|uniref:Phage gp6-like head-tail connector protein n=1 Tax=Saccharomonospora cyanea NA-134 TaxID=882082 RepID=H5XG53_9PSEU|nr:phage head-tail connector protein [Saccharomonospora cyanea]EHR62635.1 hypothetical protein SaccyDRAFT_3808 [Saccharomonospora cyanea NA-134]
MSGWVTLDDLKAEMGLEPTDTRDDEQLQLALDAAVVFVERVRHGQFNFDGDPVSELPAPTPDVKLGTLMLARRWHTRRRSPDGLVAMADQASARVASFDPDIDRLLRIGRHARPVVG